MIECTVFGGLVSDRYLEIEALPARGQDMLIQNEFAVAGGCAINMASTFNNLGGQAHIVSHIGTDDTGKHMRSYLERNGFSMRCIGEQDGETGYCLILLEPDGERTFLTKRGVESTFSEALIQKANDIRHALITGYYLLSDEAGSIVSYLERIAENDGLILFDPGPLVGDIDAGLLRRAVALSDIVAVNEAELPFVCGLTGENHIVVVKRGIEGGSVSHAGRTFHYNAAHVENVIDTTGAGDSFAAGFLYGCASGKTLPEAAELGAACAGIVVGIKGPHGHWTLDMS